jgi:hypothetical protein
MTALISSIWSDRALSQSMLGARQHESLPDKGA